MTSPISNDPQKPQVDPLLGLGEPPSYKEYRYRNPESADFKVALIKLVVYGPVAVFSLIILAQPDGQALIGALSGLESFLRNVTGLLPSILAASGVMVMDALFGGMWRTSLEEPDSLNYLFPLQMADWALFPGPIIHIGGLFGVVGSLGYHLYGVIVG